MANLVERLLLLVLYMGGKEKITRDLNGNKSE
jgi:hypothetical protein